MLNFNGSIFDGTRRWSGAELNELSSDLGQRFDAIGLSRLRVGVATESQASFVAAVAAAWNVGAVAVPLSSRAPRANSVEQNMLLRRLHDADVGVVVADKAHAAVLTGERYKVRQEFGRGEGGVLLIEEKAARARHEMREDATAIFYTSGSTGAAKGVVLSAETIEFLLATNRRINAWTRDDRFLSALPLSHVAGFVNVLAALTNEVDVFVSPSFAWPVKVIDFCVERRITVAGLVPYYLSRLVGSRRIGELKSLRLVVSSAAPMVAKDVARARDALPQLVIANAYGLTEAFRSLILTPDELRTNPPSIGRPVEGVEVEVRDDTGTRVLGEDEDGELWIRGPNVMLEYWCKPVETAAVLHDGWIRTRDIGRRRADGTYTLSGRSANLINGGGEKLCCEVLELCLSDGCKVQDIAVVETW